MSFHTKSLPRGLATVALLKARFDQRVDHVDMFMPLIMDTLANMRSKSFTAKDVEDALQDRFAVSMPQPAVITLLKRVTRRGFLKREYGRYSMTAEITPSEDIQAKKTSIDEEHALLAKGFRQYVEQQGVSVASDEEALELILSFLENNQVAMLLGAKQKVLRDTKLSDRESRLVAEFAESVMTSGSDLARILQNILEGLVVYNAAFLKDITSPARLLSGLRVFLDSNILFQLLGYEGPAPASLASETLQLLKTSGVQCLAFDKTLQEMQGILRVYEDKIGTSQGIRSLYPSPMSRYFIKNRYSPSDIRQMSATLTNELESLGVQVVTMPRHIPKFTLNEEKLRHLLADERTEDIDEPRVLHDTDCAAAILTLRRGTRANSIADVGAVFATTSVRVLANVQKWFESEGETGIAPVIHIRALTNLAWLRRPATAVNLKAHELISLCRAALQPSRKTWELFLQHLNKLEKNRSLTSDEAVAVVVSEMTEDFLVDMEMEEDEIDAESLDEVIERVSASFEAKAQERLRESEAKIEKRVINAEERAAAIEADSKRQLLEAEKREYRAAEDYRKMKLRVEGNSFRFAELIAKTCSWVLSTLAIGGAVLLIIQHPLHGGLLNWLAAGAIIAFVILELSGVLHHIGQMRSNLTAFLLPRMRRLLGADDSNAVLARSVLGLEDVSNSTGGDGRNPDETIKS